LGEDALTDSFGAVPAVLFLSHLKNEFLAHGPMLLAWQSLNKIR
jgi:hypothetical protein